MISKLKAMQPKNLTKAGYLALAVTVCFILCWELSWRAKGYKVTFNDDKFLWANARSRAYENNATVFIGSSRIKFDLDLPTWKKQTGEEAIQLSIVGTSPLLLLKDLADDEKFRGKLIVDITEVLFFSPNPAFHKSAKEAIAFYHNRTPSENLSSQINLQLESGLVFLEERRFALNTLLSDLEIPDRPGVFSFPSFPKGFEWTSYNRQTYMSDLFLQNPDDIKKQTEIWQKLILGDPSPAIEGKALQEIFIEIKNAVDKIRNRGGKVLFVRTPCSGPMEEAEKKKYPRQSYWDQMLAFTNTVGIYYEDDSRTGQFVCPEWSHLSPHDAVLYTHALVEQLRNQNWFTNTDHSFNSK